ncbi:putative Transposable element Tc1 transposase-like 24 [Homarus americanus]|uniref:Putative Transposable element Tc1 transposase-like 24 n=1 Tax=Homarus americanus TaxID=6706 RepID=A0A8J5JV39_HOMAM|nr:putative Transposable element Tc1 transposase-like 24 [Homarus americanus]
MKIKKTTPPTERAAIIAAIRNNPFSNRVATREALHLAGIQHRVPAIKERLTDQHHSGHLQFVQQYVGKGLEFWSRVVFTDEKTFASTNHGKIHLWKPNRLTYYQVHND